MAQILEGGNVMFRSLIYGRPHPATTQYIQDRFQQGSQMLSDAGRQFFGYAQELYAHLEDSNAARLMRAAGRAVRSMWQTNEIRPLTDIGMLQFAPPVMHRWLMADPEVRQLYQEQRVDGYSEQYVDLWPKQIGEQHYDYRRVMDGVVQEFTDEDGTESWFADNYVEDLQPDDCDLLLEEQVDILDSWAHMRAALKRGKEDPTSQFNADLN